MEEKKQAILLLEDGTFYSGIAVGKVGTTTGEIAFNTGMTGYQEVFTDPSYFGQIVIMTTSHIGNYGVKSSENESAGIMVSGLVTKKYSDIYSRTSADGSLDDLMVAGNCVGISDIDTRSLVRHIRNKGAMNAIISSEILDVDTLMSQLKKVPSMEGLELSSEVSTKEIFDKIPANPLFKVALLDLGVKRNIIQCLVDRGCHVRVFPMDTSLEEMKSFQPDGYMISNGPGDPSALTSQKQVVAQIVEEDLTMFGICLGHQLLGLSQGLKTEKMFNGHRGVNHPIKNLKTGKGEITSQNHGFVISKEGIDSNPVINVTHVHLNDNTIAGIEVVGKSIFSVQYHPEAAAGPHDSRYLFDQFIDNMKLAKS
ncbi:MAG: glutamine-hydrolyzing carbamoyl-phosphate synthase small subunit [Crocinitomicaceae bacterium]|nr:glutamine-hydrolyzing carbamoyl-phosphate synthase small subunit [Crocinitomicaceae bacterium]